MKTLLLRLFFLTSGVCTSKKVRVSETLFTIGWQVVRAAVANPVDSLRDE